ncbi:MAG: hypothetical protein Q8859_02690 [Bacteroidota bacterium]|nr:hypothetical protein [Bacteroidota bacterium]
MKHLFLIIIEIAIITVALLIISNIRPDNRKWSDRTEKEKKLFMNMIYVEGVLLALLAIVALIVN